MEKLVKVKKINEIMTFMKDNSTLAPLATESKCVSELSCFNEAVIRVRSGPCDHR